MQAVQLSFRRTVHDSFFAMLTIARVVTNRVSGYTKGFSFVKYAIIGKAARALKTWMTSIHFATAMVSKEFPGAIVSSFVEFLKTKLFQTYKRYFYILLCEKKPLSLYMQPANMSLRKNLITGSCSYLLFLLLTLWETMEVWIWNMMSGYNLLQ